MWILRTFAILFFLAGSAMLVGVYDYWQQSQKADDTFDGPAYVRTLMDRFGDQGGVLSVALSRSGLVFVAMPPAPEGWTAEAYMDVDDADFISTSQMNVSDAWSSEAVGHLEAQLMQLSATEDAIYDQYLRNTTRTYRNGDSRVDLYVTDPDKPVAQPLWQAYDEAWTAYYDAQSETTHHATEQGIAWTEVHTELEKASNGPLPHELRSFVGYIGDVRLDLTTRASDVALEQFLTTADWTGLRELAGAKAAPVIAQIRQSGAVDASLLPKARATE